MGLEFSRVASISEAREKVLFPKAPQSKDSSALLSDALVALRQDGVTVVEVLLSPKPDLGDSLVLAGGLKNISSDELFVKFFLASGVSPDKIDVYKPEPGTAYVQASSQRVSGNVQMRGAFSKLNIAQMYSQIYARTHFAQDNFANIVQLRFIAVPLGTYAYLAHGTEYLENVEVSRKKILQYFTVCDGQSFFSKTMTPSTLCEKYGMISVGAGVGGIYIEALANRHRETLLPVSIAASSSLLLTGAFYIGLLVYLLVVVLARGAGIVLLSGRYLNVRVAPLTVAAAYLAFCCVPILLVAIVVIAAIA